MRVSQLFTKTTKEAPAEETAKNAQLLIRAGYIHKEMAGVYAYLPLGLKVVENIKRIVREEMNRVGGQELIMASLQSQALWEKTDRWDDKKVDIWFKSELKNGTPVGFAWSHEEPVTMMMRNYLTSYRDLPTLVYQFQSKLRNELRAKSGIMRGREFIMKDMYSFSKNDKEHDEVYEHIKEAYGKVFERIGIAEETFFTFASGGAFTQFSHEFQTICEAGEDTIYLDRAKKLAVNQEVLNDDVLNQLGLKRDNLEELRAAEVGNTFSFGTAKSEQLDLTFNDEAGKAQYAVIGSYGIGITRLMGLIAELKSDDKGLVWPESIAPAIVYLVRIGSSEAALQQADELYKKLTDAGVNVLYDDRDVRPGEKFADAELLGIPYRVVSSEKTAAAGTFEFKPRTSDEVSNLRYEEVFKRLGVCD